MVITSTIGNRVAVMSGTWVQIPPTPPNKKVTLLGDFFCLHKIEGIGTLRGLLAYKKVAGGKFFSQKLRSPVPKLEEFGWTSRKDCFSNTYPTDSAK